ncbi:MAG TPA: SDR family oxidoreductase [Alphaproteobacteria bacterium]|nr:SDR family oxidoreductase [Alphaproteobacteria bacterium]
MTSDKTGRRAAIVTGAGTGIGAATALWLAEHGFDVLVNYNASAEAAERTAALCRQAGADAFALQGNVTADADCVRMAFAAEERWGRIDAVVNSAGTTRFVPMSDLGALELADFQRIFAVNTVGPYQMVRAAAPCMKRTGGAVVNISSVAGVAGTGSSYAYAASKGALNTLTLALARNLAPRIRVNAVLPGMVEGRWLLEGLGEAAYVRTREKFADDAALGRVCTPAEIAETAGWLIQAPGITGQLVTVDSGLTLGRPPAVAK